MDSTDIFRDEVGVNDRTEFFFNKSASTYLSSDEKFRISLPKSLKTLCERYKITEDQNKMVMDLLSFDKFNPEILACAYLFFHKFISKPHEAFNTCFTKHPKDEKSMALDVERYLRKLRKKQFGILSHVDSVEPDVSALDEKQIPRRYLKTQKKSANQFVHWNPNGKFVEVVHEKVTESFGNQEFNGVRISPSQDGENDTSFDIVCVGKNDLRTMMFLTNFMNFLMDVSASRGFVAVLPKIHDEEFVVVFANMGTCSDKPSLRLFVMKQFNKEVHPEPKLFFKHGHKRIDTDVPVFIIDKYSTSVDENQFDVNKKMFEKMLGAIHHPKAVMQNNLHDLFDNFQAMFSECALKMNDSNELAMKTKIVNGMREVKKLAMRNFNNLPELRLQTVKENRLFQLIQQ